VIDDALDLPLVLTPGDPAGVGPEITAKALAERPSLAAVVVGDAAAFRPWAERYHVRATVIDTAGADEPAEIAAIRWAVAEQLAGRAGPLVTGPIHKGRLLARGFPHPGHTEFLGALCGGAPPVMAFTGGSLMVALVTVHLPLRAVAAALTPTRVIHTLQTANAALRDQLGLARRRLAVCGVNPHAGEGGALGDEELTIIGPACEQARSQGVDAIGPMSAETAFRLAAAGEVDMVIAMYHDQGLAPLKLVDFGRSVNWTLGLPIVRTSVDHGTADDIAGRGVADPSSLLAAIGLAERLRARPSPRDNARPSTAN
jgi:4-hydroxythreonine-4-phosphate dehydrogenase